VAVRVELTLEQLAGALRNLKKQDIDSLELILDADTTKEILKRRKDAQAGKTLPLNRMTAFQDI